MKYDVFLSYSPDMYEQADKIKAAFTEKNITFTDAQSFAPGADYTDEFLKALNSCTALVLIASPEIQDGGAVKSEVETAFKLKKPIIPYIVKQFDLNNSFVFLTGNSTPIDAVGDSDAQDKLIDAVEAIKDYKPDPKPKIWLLIAVIIAAAVIITAAAALAIAFIINPAPTDTGADGDLSWKYYEDSKTLVISGKGEGADFNVYTEDEAAELGKTANAEELIPWQKYADNIETVKVEDGVTALGTRTFFGLENLKSVSLPDTIDWLHDSLFYGCHSLKSVTIPDSVTTVSSGAFCDCPISSLNIPANVSEISGAPCFLCYDLAEITVDPANTHYKSVDGVLYDSDMTMIVQYPAAKSGVSFTVPDTVTSLQMSAFNSTNDLEEITLPDGLAVISEFCFGDSGIKEIYIPDSVTTMGLGAFSDCDNLSSVRLSENLTSIEDSAFFQCPKLTEITVPDSVKSVGILSIGIGQQDGQYGKYHTVIKAHEGSPAIDYAKEYDLEYEIIK